MHFPLAAIVLLGCSGKDAADSAAADPDLPSAWVGLGDAPEEDALDAEQLSADLQAQLEATQTIKGDYALDAFEQLLGLATDICPSSAIVADDTYGTSLYFDGICSTGEWIYKGPATIFWWNDQQILAEGQMAITGFLPPEIRWTGRGFNGQTDIYREDGLSDFNCSCTMVGATGFVDSKRYYFGMSQGTAHFDTDQPLGTWMETPSVVPDFFVATTEEEAAHTVRIEGSLSGVGERYDASRFEMEFAADADASGWTCDPTGTLTIAFRDGTYSSWLESSFTIDSSCRACADDAALTDVCVDLTPLVDWEGQPW